MHPHNVKYRGDEAELTYLECQDAPHWPKTFDRWWEIRPVPLGEWAVWGIRSGVLSHSDPIKTQPTADEAARAALRTMLPERPAKAETALGQPEQNAKERTIAEALAIADECLANELTAMNQAREYAALAAQRDDTIRKMQAVLREEDAPSPEPEKPPEPKRVDCAATSFDPDWWIGKTTLDSARKRFAVFDNDGVVAYGETPQAAHEAALATLPEQPEQPPKPKRQGERVSCERWAVVHANGLETTKLFKPEPSDIQTGERCCLVYVREIVEGEPTYAELIAKQIEHEAMVVAAGKMVSSAGRMLNETQVTCATLLAERDRLQADLDVIAEVLRSNKDFYLTARIRGFGVYDGTHHKAIGSGPTLADACRAAIEKEKPRTTSDQIGSHNES